MRNSINSMNGGYQSLNVMQYLSLTSLTWSKASLIGLLLVTLPIARAQENPAQNAVDFAHDVLPILKAKCGKCHTNGSYKGGFSMDTRASFLESGTVDLDDSTESEFLRRIRSDDADERMPPEGPRLLTNELQTLQRWVDEGVVWPAEVSLAESQFKRPLKLRKVGVDRAGHPIDYLVNKYFVANDVSAPPPLPDHLFVRRAKLDLLGLLPTSQEIEDFERNVIPNKHELLVDEFLTRRRDYADHWLSFWNDLLRNDYAGTGYIDGGRKQITEWLYEALLDNRPYDLFVRQLIDPQPESEGFIKGIKWRGRVNASQIEPLQFSQNVSQVFLGINMKCASCHDSFIDDWKLEDAYGMAAIASPEPLEIHRCDVGTGVLANSKFVFSDLGSISQESPREQRLQQLASLLTDEENGRFARTIVNRIWERLMGRGLVHPVDVMANQAWSEKVLDWLAFDLVEHDYDLKHTLRRIATSQLYRKESVSLEGNDAAKFVFRGIQRKRMSAEQLVDAIWRLTDSFPNAPDARVSTGVSGERVGQWIWKPDAIHSPAGESVTFRFQFQLEDIPVSAQCIAACDNSYTLFLNGQRLLAGKEWASPDSVSLTSSLRKGMNTLLVRGKNGGSSPNPAALTVELLLLDEAGALIQLGTSNKWEWTQAKTDKLGEGQNVSWKAAKLLSHGESVYQQASLAIARKIGDFRSQKESPVRASLVKSNLLMRSLGRPNREQVVTTRPAELSTLQALDLSNGEQLAAWLKHGALYWLGRQKEAKWSNPELLTEIFQQALSREPSEGELEVLGVDRNLDPQALEDVLWMVMMLPEFQFVH